MTKKLKNKTIWTISLSVLLLLTLAFIWGHSVRSAPESQAESMKILEIIRPPLELIIGKGKATNHLVRKLAHFSEFGALGVELMALSVVQKRTKLQNIVNCLFAGLSAAVTDETIQIFSNRGSQVQDVLLDFAGCCTGLLLAGIITAIISAVRRRRDRERTQQ